MPDDMENWWWEDFEGIIRRHQGLKLAYSVFVFVTALIGVLGTVFGWLGISSQGYLLVTLAVCCMATTTYIVAGIASMRAKKLRRLLDIFRDLAAIQRRNYYLEAAAYQVVVQPNGDALCSRSVILRGTRAGCLYWDVVNFGVTPGTDGVHRFEDLQFAVYQTDTHVPLKNVIVSDDEHGKQVVVMFNPPVKGMQALPYSVSYRWPKAWKKLLLEGTDLGAIRVQQRTKLLDLFVQVPDGYFIQAFHVAPAIGIVNIAANRASATWSAAQVPPGEYTYTIVCSRV